MIEAVRAGIEQDDASDEEQGDTFEVYPQNWSSVLFFSQVGTQWNAIGGMERTHWIGLNYAGVETQMTQDRKKRAKLWAELRVMERAALEVLNSA